MNKLNLNRSNTKFSTGNFEMQEILIDKSATGHNRPWKGKAMSRDQLAKLYDNFNPKKAQRLRKCAQWLRFAVGKEGFKRLVSTFFCRVRLCPMCIWRRSLKVFNQVFKIMKFLENDYTFVFLTLTTRNCSGGDLQKTIDDFMAGWNLFANQKFFKDTIKGYYKAFELTHNINDDTYHPHFHCVFAVNKSYFQKNYISSKKWREYWQRCMKLDYEPWVYVKKCYGDISNSVAEVAKYSVAENSYIIPENKALSLETVKLLDKVLNKRRFVSLGGVFKDVHKKLELDDAESGDLTDIGSLNLAIPDFSQEDYFWHSGYRQYFKYK